MSLLNISEVHTLVLLSYARFDYLGIQRFFNPGLLSTEVIERRNTMTNFNWDALSFILLIGTSPKSG